MPTKNIYFSDAEYARAIMLAKVLKPKEDLEKAVTAVLKEAVLVGLTYLEAQLKKEGKNVG